MAVYADSLDLRTHVIEQIGQEGIADVWQWLQSVV